MSHTPNTLTFDGNNRYSIRLDTITSQNVLYQNSESQRRTYSIQPMDFHAISALQYQLSTAQREVTIVLEPSGSNAKIVALKMQKGSLAHRALTGLYNAYTQTMHPKDDEHAPAPMAAPEADKHGVVTFTSEQLQELLEAVPPSPAATLVR